jgi:hypothetical protein
VRIGAIVRSKYVVLFTSLEHDAGIIEATIPAPKRRETKSFFIAAPWYSRTPRRGKQKP